MNQPRPLDMNGAATLRDFFMARDGRELERVYGSLAECCRKEAPAVEDWQVVEFAFNRLFVGPAALEAPPFASVYLDTEPLVMGKTTLDVREMYASLGLESPWKNRLPDDHISLELDAALAMDHVALLADVAEIHDLRRQFLEHMNSWVPGFIEHIFRSSFSHPAIDYAAGCLSDWLERQLKVLKF